jgi:nuclear transport factor 2 (NTF2) superfamily protein
MNPPLPPFTPSLPRPPLRRRAWPKTRGIRAIRLASCSPSELDYRLIKEVWAFRENRIAVRFAYEWHDDSGNWLRSYGNENWEFDEHGLMRLRIASINERPSPRDQDLADLVDRGHQGCGSRAAS